MVESVSIIVPVYNVELYLHECIDSILHQTYQGFELILVNDGSTDRSGEICDEYQSEHKNITVIHQENQGQAAARNKGVNIAKSDWILFVDSDDIIHPQLLEFLVLAINESGANIAVVERVFGNRIPVSFSKKRSFLYEYHPVNEDFLLYLFNNSNSSINDIYWIVYSKLIRKDILVKIPFVEGKIYEDNEVMCKWLVESNSIAIIPQEMYFYRDNPSGTMNSAFSKKKLDYLWALESQIKFFNSIEYYEICKLIMNEYFYSAVHFGKRFICEFQDEEACKSLMKETERKRKAFSKIYDYNLDVHTKDFIMKYAHPIKFRIQKKIKGYYKRLINVR